jgi:hypothetical protein
VPGGVAAAVDVMVGPLSPLGTVEGKRVIAVNSKDNYSLDRPGRTVNYLLCGPGAAARPRDAALIGLGKERPMPRATSISQSKLTATVQEAVKAAVQKHPKLRLAPPPGVTFGHLILGFVLPDRLPDDVTLRDTQAFADDVAAHIAGAHVDAFGPARPQGAVVSIGHHVILGIPALADLVTIEK